MEYASFVRDLRKESYNSSTCPPDTQYAKEFEKQMQALVINFDIEDRALEQQQEQPYPITSTPLLSSVSGLKWKARRKATILDETEQTDVPKKKKALDMAQKSNEDHELQRSFDSSEGISMRFDSFSSSDDIPESVAWNELMTDLTASGSMHTREDHAQRHAHQSFPFEAIQGEDSLLEPSADISPNDKTMFSTKCVSTTKRTYDEANS